MINDLNSDSPLNMKEIILEENIHIMVLEVSDES